MSGDLRAERVASNESAFRAVNERVEELADRLDVEPQFVCECDRLDCVEQLDVPRADYEAVRAAGSRFVVAPGHQIPELERVVEDRGSWLVVEKTGDAGEAAEDRNPRA